MNFLLGDGQSLKYTNFVVVNWAIGGVALKVFGLYAGRVSPVSIVIPKRIDRLIGTDRAVMFQS
jgi:hypothetical protein